MVDDHDGECILFKIIVYCMRAAKMRTVGEKNKNKINRKKTIPAGFEPAIS